MSASLPDRLREAVTVLDEPFHREGIAALLEEAALCISDAIRVPQGWTLVPITPSDAMNEAGFSAACRHDNGDTAPSLEIAPATYAAMIAAAPEAPK